MVAFNPNLQNLIECIFGTFHVALVNSSVMLNPNATNRPYISSPSMITVIVFITGCHLQHPSKHLKQTCNYADLVLHSWLNNYIVKQYNWIGYIAAVI